MIRDIACGAAGLVLAALYYLLADALPRSLLDDPTGAHGLPKLLAWVLGGLSLALMASSVLRRVAAGEGRPIAAHLRAGGMLALGLGYLLVLPWLGYLGAILLFLLAVSLFAGARLSAASIAVSVIGALVLWGVFVRLFGIAMPAGVWLS